MKFAALSIPMLLAALLILSAIACKTKETTTEKTTTEVNPVTGAESVQREITTESNR